MTHLSSTKGVLFSPTNRSWAAVTTEGLIVYSLDDQLIFDPFELDVDITTQSVMETLKSKQYLKALVVSSWRSLSLMFGDEFPIERTRGH